MQNQTTGQAAGSPAPITAELVREVAEKVYALMLKDLKISRERGHIPAQDRVRKGQTR